MFYALVSHANAHTIRGRPSPKDDKHFQNGLFQQIPWLESTENFERSAYSLQNIFFLQEKLTVALWFLESVTNFQASRITKPLVYSQQNWYRFNACELH